MHTQKVCFVALTAMFLTTSLWAHAGSPTDRAQPEASNKKTSQKKGTNTASQGESIRSTTVEQSAKSPRDPQSGLPTGQRLHKPIVVETDKSSAAVVSTKQTDQASPKLSVTKPTDQASPKLSVTKPTDQASPKLSVKATDKASPGLLKQGSTTPLSASPAPTPAIKKGTTSKP
jgi:hypothetical protein